MPKTTTPHFFRREIRITTLFLSITFILTLILSYHLLTPLMQSIALHQGHQALRYATFITIVGYLMYGNFVYQITRLGHLKRTENFAPVPLNKCLDTLQKDVAPLAILVPSYKEDAAVIEQTILSAALQEYPNSHVVLLIDDPISPLPEDQAKLEAARQLPQKIHELLDTPRTLVAQAIDTLMAQQTHSVSDYWNGERILAQLYRNLATWFRQTAGNYPCTTHTDKLFIARILLSRAHRYQHLAQRIEENLDSQKRRNILKELHQLAHIFAPTIESFERKQYINLSHEPNKAMNLNSYIALMGKTVQPKNKEGRAYLQEVPTGTPGSITIPNVDYLITLDADSLLLPGYAARLIHFLQQPGHERVAVVQTPYSAIPQAPNELEYTAGATTDIQYLIHQGFTHYDATFWVGANALIHKAALDDIASHSHERGFRITRYIQDRTVIEDTESSVDLAMNGWRLANYPARLAYSATPPDFGALLIQRRRWANGGLIIAPKLLRYIFSRPFSLKKLAEGFVRFHYLTSIAGVNLGLLLLLLIPFHMPAGNLWLPLAALPYYLLYTRDLRLIGYRPRDVFRVYALNLMLLPINLGGVLKSLQQAITGEKIPFGRTPKVQGRTTAPPIYIASLYFFWAYSLAAGIIDTYHELWLHAVFSLMNASFFTYVIVRFLGLRASYEDTLAQIPIPIRRSG